MFMRYFGDAPGHRRRKNKKAQPNEGASEGREAANDGGDEPDDEQCARVQRVRDAHAELSDDEIETYGYSLSDDDDDDDPPGGEESESNGNELQHEDVEMLDQFEVYDAVGRDGQGSGGGGREREDRDTYDDEDDESSDEDEDDEPGPDEIEYAKAGMSV